MRYWDSPRWWRDFDRPEMHSAVCDDCWANCEVPFRPTWSKPVFCSRCYWNNRDSWDNRDNRNNRNNDYWNSRWRDRDNGRWRDRDRDREPVTMHSAVCNECWVDCEVPFKPSSDKPLFCDACFSKNKPDRKWGWISEEQYNTLNTKLDKIIELLWGSKEVAVEKTTLEEITE